jgi:hypothetical protein
MGTDTFKEGLAALGYTVELKDQDKLMTQFVVAGGRFKERQVKLGFQVPPDFEINPPGGPHISPRLIPINPNAEDHSRAAESPFGPEWEYLSRPFPSQWARKRTVKRYMEWVSELLNTL